MRREDITLIKDNKAAKLASNIAKIRSEYLDRLGVRIYREKLISAGMTRFLVNKDHCQETR